MSLVLERYESGQLVVRAVAETGAELDVSLVVTARAEDPELAWSGGQERIGADGIAVFDALAVGRYRVAPWATECEEVEPVIVDVLRTPVAQSADDGTSVLSDLVEGEWRLGFEPGQRDLELMEEGRPTHMLTVLLDGSRPQPVTLAVRTREGRR
ncbi:MAG TPA: hypothetical protein VMV46_22680 [Thermoanaerobaculia bacterium]|nr:hypothetical protein [Thermoanaerobaculia bacterium]